MSWGEVCGFGDAFLIGATVKAAQWRRTPHGGGLRGEMETRRNGRAERAPPLQRRKTALEEVEGVHVDEDGGLGDFFGVGTGEGAG